MAYADCVRFMVAIVVVGTACKSQPGGYAGVSAEMPTGSPRIAATELVLAMDMTTMAPDGRLRDFGPHRLHGAVTRSNQHRGARGFTTTDDRVDLPEDPALALDGPFTIAVRLRVDQLGIHQHVIACDDKFVLWIPPENRWRIVDTLGHGAQTVTPVVAVVAHSVVAVFDGTKGTELTPGTLQIHVDGAAVPLEPVNRSNDSPLRWAPGPLYPTDACHIGYESHQGDEEHKSLPFVGAIDDVLVFRRVWTPAEIAAHAL